MGQASSTLPALLTTVVHNATFEIGCDGTPSDCLCRVTDSTTRQDTVHDAYYSPVERGFFWLREHRGLWIASGMVNKALFRGAGTTNCVLYQLKEEALYLDEPLATCVELVETSKTSLSKGEYDQFS